METTNPQPKPPKPQPSADRDRREFLAIYNSILRGMFSQYERRSETYCSGYVEMDQKDEDERSMLLVERAFSAARFAFAQLQIEEFNSVINTVGNGE